MSQKIKDVLNAMTEESIEKSRENAKSRSVLNNVYNEITLDGAFEVLKKCRHSLLASLQNSKFSIVPITMQESIWQSLGNINGTLGVPTYNPASMSSSILNLELQLWQSRLMEIPELEYSAKARYDEIARVASECKKVYADVSATLPIQKQIQELHLLAQNLKEEISKSSQEAKTHLGDLSKNFEVSNSTKQQIDALLQTIQQREKDTQTLLAASKSSQMNISATEGGISTFFKQIEAYRQAIETTKKTAETSVEKHTNAVSELVSRLNELEKQINTHLQKATGISLFHSFETRKNQIGRQKHYWLFALVALLGISLLLTHSLMRAQNIDLAFYLKLSYGLPLIYAITFATFQYRQERRLEEEYAIRSNISLSLEPFSKYVSATVDEKKADDIKRYNEFVVSSINKIFSSPTDSVFPPAKSHVVHDEFISKEFLEKVGQVSKQLLGK